MINRQVIEQLTNIYKDDKEILDIIYDAIHSFEQYHNAIFEMETWMKVYSYNSVDKEEYQYKVTDMDKRRTMCHNSVLSSVNILNRLAVKENLSPIYEGIVSEERPYRREVANAVMEYISSVIDARR